MIDFFLSAVTLKAHYLSLFTHIKTFKKITIYHSLGNVKENSLNTLHALEKWHFPGSILQEIIMVM